MYAKLRSAHSRPRTQLSLTYRARRAQMGAMPLARFVAVIGFIDSYAVVLVGARCPARVPLSVAEASMGPAPPVAHHCYWDAPMPYRTATKGSVPLPKNTSMAKRIPSRLRVNAQPMRSLPHRNASK
jgi:hypothetical protein